MIEFGVPVLNNVTVTLLPGGPSEVFADCLSMAGDVQLQLARLASVVTWSACCWKALVSNGRSSHVSKQFVRDEAGLRLPAFCLHFAGCPLLCHLLSAVYCLPSTDCYLSSLFARPLPSHRGHTDSCFPFAAACSSMERKRWMNLLMVFLKPLRVHAENRDSSRA